MRRRILTCLAALPFLGALAQSYPRNYFRNPLSIPMQLVANFGEIRTNHWHMGLDIRTQQRVNLPVYAAAGGYVSRVLVEPGGFGQAVYITHPNGFTTLYAHMNGFFPALEQYVRKEQYARESWRVNLQLPPGLFPVEQGTYIGLSGSTGGSEGPHVHFEIRDARTENCLNPLLFGMPIADAVPPSLTRIALYDRTRSTWMQQPQLVVPGRTIRSGSRVISFAVGAVDRFSGTPNPNGIYAARMLVDGKPVSEFVLDDISYDETRYINAQLDFRYKSSGGGNLQHLTPLPGAMGKPYIVYNEDGALHLDDEAVHTVTLELRDAAGNLTRRTLQVQYDPSLSRSYTQPAGERFLPNQINIFERPDFELFTTERTLYDTILLNPLATSTGTSPLASAVYGVLPATIPAHDSVTVRIRQEGLTPAQRGRAVIRNKAGTRTFLQRARWNGDWALGRFRQFGTYQLLIDGEPPVLNSPPANLSRATRIVFTPTDNLEVIRSFRATLNGRWLRFTNDKGRSWIYTFDENFPRGEHQLQVRVEDEAGNITERSWTVTR
jgi:murein DD-endopeptidase MepM/ murein hydrolase activator NlpD